MKCTSLVIKVASRCNLNCSYCYMYNMGDNSWRSQPKIMNEDVTNALLIKVQKHCIKHNISDFLFAFHGGEPLLAKPSWYRKFINDANNILQGITKAHYTIQTNGTLLNKDWCVLFKELNIHIGISIDGEEAANDLHRVDHKGKGSYQSAVLGLNTALTNSWHQKTLGLLSVINTEAEPVRTYQHFKKLGAPHLDFLLPYNNFDNLPPGRSIDIPIDTSYGDWLIKVFDAWYNDPEKTKPSIRMFDGIIGSLFGEEFPNDLFGSFNNQLLVIETNGDIEAVDYLKACGNGFTKEDANILNHELDDAVDSKLANLYINCHSKMNRQCLACPVSEICGGANLASRYSSLNGFNNPSVYCNDLMKLITHIQGKVFKEFSPSLLQEQGVKIFSYEQVLETIKENISSVAEPDYVAELESF